MEKQDSPSANRRVAGSFKKHGAGPERQLRGFVQLAHFHIA
jgi:hypothetical protein